MYPYFQDVIQDLSFILSLKKKHSIYISQIKKIKNKMIMKRKHFSFDFWVNILILISNSYKKNSRKCESSTSI